MYTVLLDEASYRLRIASIMDIGNEHVVLTPIFHASSEALMTMKPVVVLTGVSFPSRIKNCYINTTLVAPHVTGG
jgi:hypothetical protein